MAKDGGAVVSSPVVDVKAKSLFHALSEIEQFSTAELETVLPEGAVPILSRYSFIDIGIKNGLITTLVTFLLSPLTISVVEYLIPVFGRSEPGFFDKLYVYFFACTPAVGMSLLIGFIAIKAYRGNITKSLTNNLLFSYGLAKIGLSVFLLAVMHLIYNRVYTAHFAYSLAGFISDTMNIIRVSVSFNGVYSFLLMFRESIVKGANFATLLHMGTAIILLVSHIIGINRTKRIEILKKEWE